MILMCTTPPLFMFNMWQPRRRLTTQGRLVNFKRYLKKRDSFWKHIWPNVSLFVLIQQHHTPEESVIYSTTVIRDSVQQMVCDLSELITASQSSVHKSIQLLSAHNDSAFFSLFLFSLIRLNQQTVVWYTAHYSSSKVKKKPDWTHSDVQLYA